MGYLIQANCKETKLSLQTVKGETSLWPNMSTKHGDENCQKPHKLQIMWQLKATMLLGTSFNNSLLQLYPHISSLKCFNAITNVCDSCKLLWIKWHHDKLELHNFFFNWSLFIIVSQIFQYKQYRTTFYYKNKMLEYIYI